MQAGRKGVSDSLVCANRECWRIHNLKNALAVCFGTASSAIFVASFSNGCILVGRSLITIQDSGRGLKVSRPSLMASHRRLQERMRGCTVVRCLVAEAMKISLAY